MREPDMHEPESRGRPRIVSLLPAATEMICGAGWGHCLVGVSHQCNWPPGVERLPRLSWSRVESSASSRAIDAQVKLLRGAGAALYEIDVPRLASLRPTLIVTQSQCDVCAVSYTDVEQHVAARPELAGAQVLALNPRSLADALADVERIGAAVGASAQARAYVESLRARIENVRRQGAAQPHPRRRVVVIEWTDPLMVAGNWTPELAAIAGADYPLAVAGRPSPCIDWQSVAAAAPDLLVVAPCGLDLDRSRCEAQRLATCPGWRELPAATRDRVLVVDGDAYFNCPGPRLVDSLELLAHGVSQCED